MAQAKTLSSAEIERVLAYVETRAHATRNRAMLLCTHMAGMRVGEVAALRICDVLGADGCVRMIVKFLVQPFASVTFVV